MRPTVHKQTVGANDAITTGNRTTCGQFVGFGFVLFIIVVVVLALCRKDEP